MNLPNKLTMLRVIMIPVFVFFFLSDVIALHYLWALLVFAVASLTDMLDGNIARKRGLVTDFGKLMDPLADKLLVMSAMLCLIPVGMVHVAVVIVILAREFIVTSIRLVAAGNGTVIAADHWGKIKTVFQMVWICFDLLYLFLHTNTRYDAAFLFIHGLLLTGVLVLTVFSGFNYIWKNRYLFADA